MVQPLNFECGRWNCGAKLIQVQTKLIYNHNFDIISKVKEEGTKKPNDNTVLKSDLQKKKYNTVMNPQTIGTTDTPFKPIPCPLKKTQSRKRPIEDVPAETRSISKLFQTWRL